MRRWVKFTVAGASLVVLAFLALAGTSAYFVFRHFDSRAATEAVVVHDIDAVRARFRGRDPLIELVNPQAGDIRMHRLTHPDGLRATTVHILAWTAEDGDRVQTQVPLWLMQFNSINVLSRIGLAPDRFKLTVDDIARYGPGIVAYYDRPGEKRVLIWAE